MRRAVRRSRDDFDASREWIETLRDVRELTPQTSPSRKLSTACLILSATVVVVEKDTLKINDRETQWIIFESHFEDSHRKRPRVNDKILHFL